MTYLCLEKSRATLQKNFVLFSIVVGIDVREMDEFFHTTFFCYAGNPSRSRNVYIFKWEIPAN